MYCSCIDASQYVGCADKSRVDIRIFWILLRRCTRATGDSKDADIAYSCYPHVVGNVAMHMVCVPTKDSRSEK